MTATAPQRSPAPINSNLTVALTSLAFFALVAGCSTPDIAATRSDPWALQYEEAYEFATSDFLREVLDDRLVEPYEYAEMTRRYVDCVNERFPEVFPPPASVDLDANGLIEARHFQASEEVAMSEQADLAVDQCWELYLGQAAVVYEASVRNPEARDFLTMLFECVHEQGVVPPGYTRENMEADMYWDSAPNATGDGGAPPREAATDVDFWEVGGDCFEANEF